MIGFKSATARLSPVLLGLSLALVLNPAPPSASADEARAVMEKVDARDDGDNMTADMEMVLIDRHNKQRVRRIRSFSQDQGRDVRRLMFFLEPADVRGTAFLTYDYDDAEKDDDQWMYLPALGKTKRIASSDKTGAFMGSDFSYADMTRQALDNYNYKLLKEIEDRGHKVWVIESLPKTRRIVDLYGYTRSLLLVRQDNFVIVRAVHWVKEGRKVKYMDVKNLKKIEGIWQPLEMHMTTKKGKMIRHRTILRWHSVRFNQDLKAEMFTVRRMEKGL